MFMFRILGSWVRGLYLMGFGAFWLGIAWYFSRLGFMGPGKPTIVGLLLMGGLAFFSGLMVVIRGTLSVSQHKPPKSALGWRDDGKRSASDTGFDAEAAIARYLQSRPADAGAATAEPVPEAPVRPSFGRKQA